MKINEWKKESWKSYRAMQQPDWPNKADYNKVLSQLEKLPALVFAGETRALKKSLEDASIGKAFILQCGDCSEEFSRCNGSKIHALIKVILQMSVILAYAGERKVVNIGRIAGQYAKPRSSDYEKIDDLVLPSYRGDMVNSIEPNLEARLPDPYRLLEGYFRSTATLNLVRAFTRGGYAALDMIESWHSDFINTFPINPKYKSMVAEIRKALRFAQSLGMDLEDPKFNQISLYTSHEALLLGYEEALTRIDTTTGKWYDTSGHFLWVGDRTRQLEGAHIEFIRGICNPIGIKIGPDFDLEEIIGILRKVNPENIAGRIALITRFGADKVSDYLPGLIRKIGDEGQSVVWVCDPMHGNTYKNEFYLKSRRFDDIYSEIKQFFHIHKNEGTIPGGVHLELTGESVTECTGGRRGLSDRDLTKNYQSSCDPRLNEDQAVELAFEIADLLQDF